MRTRPRQLTLLLRALMLLMVASLLAPSASAANAFITATDVVNIRICPATDCEIVATANLGEPLEVIGNSVNGYVPVVYNGIKGFAYALFVADQTKDTWFTQGEAGCNRVAFIFNIGVGYTPSQGVLDTLQSYGVAATMFPMGNWAAANPDYLGQLAAAGFPIGTHGDQALYLTGLTDSQIQGDLLDSVSAISAVTGEPVIPWATPYAADTDPRVRRVIAQLGFVPVGWTVSANDYSESATADGVYSRVVNGVSDGAIVEFHLDGPVTDSSTGAALPAIIETLQSAGYTFVTVPEMATPCGPAF